MISVAVDTVKCSKALTVLSNVNPARLLWLGANLERSHRNLMNSVLEFSRDSSEANYRELSKSLDIFWSSKNIFNGMARKPFLNYYDTHKTMFDNIDIELSRYDALLPQIKAGKNQALDEMYQSLKNMVPHISASQRFILQSEVVDAKTVRDQEYVRFYYIILQVLFLLILVIVALFLSTKRFKAENRKSIKAQETIDLFKSISDASMVGICVNDSNGDILYQTASFEDFKGEPLQVLPFEGDTFSLYSYAGDKHAFGKDLSLNDDMNIAIRVNITQQQILFAKTVKALQNHESAAEAKADFLAKMSHEMRTPLNGVLGLLTLLLEGKLEPEQRGYALTAKESGEVLLSLIEDILDYSKIEAGKLAFENTEFSIAELVAGVCDMLAPKAYEKDIEITWYVDQSVPSILCGDPGRLRQILLNLAGNAVKFTERGGVTIEMALGADQDGKIILSGQVSDTGIGIPFEAQDSMFGEFNQLDASFSRRFGGSGLGLAITRRLIEAMGGSIRVFSEIDKGSIFSFSVNLNKGEEVAPLLEADTVERNILYWGEEGLNTQLTLHNLRNMGHKVTFTQTENELLTNALNQNFDVIYLDTKPLEETGYALAKKLVDEKCEIPICLLQATRDRVKEKILITNGSIRSVLQKPIHTKVFIDNLKYLNEELPVEEEEDNVDSLIPLGQGHRLLLVEDSQTNRLVASVILRKAGFHVDWVVNGAEAVDAVQKQPYDVVLMDISMPIMDGEEATKLIRSLPGAERDIPIIALTAHAMPGDRERFLSAGMDDYLTKPLDSSLMLTTIHQYISKSKDDGVNVRPSNENIDEVKTAKEPSVDLLFGPDFRDFPLLDMGVIDQMRIDTGDDTIPMLIGVFKEEVETRVVNIKDEVAQQNIENLCREAHTLKSSSGSFGAMQMNALAKSIELAAKSSNFDKLEGLIEELEPLSLETLAAFDRLLISFSNE